MEVTSSGSTVESADQLSPRARLSAVARQGHCEAARQGGNDNELYLSARSMAISINMRIRSATPELLEWDMHDLWHLFYQASMNISYLHPGIDRLALQVIQFQFFGSASERGQSYGLTSGGYVWRDLPFFVDDMSMYWAENHASMSSAQRLSFAQFLAKTAAGVSNSDRLCGIALRVLRDTLETPRTLGTIQDQAQTAEVNRDPAELSIAALLPAMNAWLSQADLTIVKLCECSSRNGRDSSIVDLGPLLRNSPAAEWQDIAAGFNPRRWIFWLSRLQELARSAKNSGQESLEQVISGVIDNMTMAVEEASGDRLIKDLDAAYSVGLLARPGALS